MGTRSDEGSPGNPGQEGASGHPHAGTFAAEDLTLGEGGKKGLHEAFVHLNAPSPRRLFPRDTFAGRISGPPSLMVPTPRLRVHLASLH